MINNKRKLNRLKDYNYSHNGWYFVTVCTENKIQHFGKINNDEMQCSEYGELVIDTWKNIPKYYKHVFLDQWILMPNHIHGIIVIQDPDSAVDHTGTEHCSIPTATYDIPDIVGTGQCPVLRGNQQPLQTSAHYGQLSKIIKSFKEVTVKTIRKNFNDYGFSWQRLFYDYIIRTEESLDKIRRYIYYNTAKWVYDRNNQNNSFKNSF